MSKKLPTSQAKSITFQRAELTQKLDSALHTEERIQVLLELGKLLRRNASTEATHYVQTALQLSKSCNHKLLEAHSLLLLSRIQSVTNDYHSALESVSAALQLYQRLREEHYKYESLLLMAALYGWLGRHDEAFQIFNNTLEYFQRNDAKVWIVRCLNSMGLLYKTQTNQAAAIAKFLEGIAIAEEQNLTLELPRLYNNIALTYKQFGDLSGASHYFQASIKIYSELGDVLGRAIASANLGENWLRLEEYDKAFKYLSYALRLSHRLGQVHREANAWNGLGRIYIQLEALEKAEYCHLKGLELLQQIPLSHFTLSTYRNLAILYEAKGEHLTGIAYGEKGIKGAREINEPIWELECADILSKLYEKEKNFSEALRYALIYKEMKLKAFAPAKIKNAMEVSFHSQIQKLQDAVEEKEKRLKELQANLESKDTTLSTMALQLLQQESIRNRKSPAKKEHLQQSQDKQFSLDPAWENLIEQISKVDKLFYYQLARTYSQLTTAERKVCTLIRVGLASKEIADLLNISVRTVEVHRSNARKKLQIPHTTTLGSFIASL